jgi:hypothetical protein
MTSTQKVLGSIVSLWRYPVKSMMGEELNASEVTKDGLLGDRAYALVDDSDGKVASAKNPRKWPQMFDCRAALADAPSAGVKVPPVRITLPDGTVVNSEQSDLHQILSKVLKREVALHVTAHGHQEAVESASPNLRTVTAEEYWPDIEGLDHRDIVTDFGLPEGSFFDCASVHLLTTANKRGDLVLIYLRRHWPSICVCGVPSAQIRLLGLHQLHQLNPRQSFAPRWNKSCSIFVVTKRTHRCRPMFSAANGSTIVAGVRFTTKPWQRGYSDVPRIPSSPQMQSQPAQRKAPTTPRSGTNSRAHRR